MSATTRRAILAAPAAAAAGAAFPHAATPPPSCLELGREYGRRIRAYQHADRKWLPQPVKDTRYAALCHARDAVGASAPRTVGDVQAKIVWALERVNWCVDNADDLSSAEEAAEALRECLLALQSLTGVPLLDLGADFVDFPLSTRLRPDRVLPTIHAE